MNHETARVQREVQQLKRELVKTKEREQQTRRGCLDLVQAMRGFAMGAEGQGTLSSDAMTELVDQAAALLAPDAEWESA